MGGFPRGCKPASGCCYGAMQCPEFHGQTGPWACRIAGDGPYPNVMDCGERVGRSGGCLAGQNHGWIKARADVENAQSRSAFQRKVVRRSSDTPLYPIVRLPSDPSAYSIYFCFSQSSITRLILTRKRSSRAPASWSAILRNSRSAAAFRQSSFKVKRANCGESLLWIVCAT
jgi:hypothetical protein